MELNSQYQLEFTAYDDQSVAYNSLSVEASVYWQDQEYIVKQVASAHSSGVNTIQVTAVHVAYEVSRVRQRQVKTGTLTYSVNDVLAFYLSGNKLGFTWQVIGNFDKQQITDLGNSSGKDMLSKIASTWSDAVFWPDNKNIRIYQHDAIAKNLGNRIDYLHNTSEVKLTYDSTGLVNQVKVYGKQKENTGTDSDKTEYYFTPFLVTDEQSVKQWELHPGDDLSDERFTDPNAMRASALAKMTSDPPLTIETSEQRAGEPALMEIRRLEIRPSGFATQVEIVAYKYYPLDKAKSTEVTLNNRAKTILNYKKAGSDALDKALAALKAQRKAILQAAENSQRSYDSRLAGTPVPANKKPQMAVRAAVSRDDLPLYTLKVAGDNPDFGLPKGSQFAVLTKAEGVLGLAGYISNWLTNNNQFVFNQIKNLIGTIKGDPGEPGRPGKDGNDGHDGQSAYDIAVAAGFEGTKEQWLASLKGDTGASLSAIALTVDGAGTIVGGEVTLDNGDTLPVKINQKGDKADDTTDGD
ncbi:minor structural protein [Loigolactobacillus rennini DSM 20253]|uniref:Minor structural protein n=1 Tax=Loigolactobacillus rennini DSM 20253 TaxID=1423796 RepID=A0A0R2CPM3_9LACO|nr:minor structural protein [Loigolactobacillus rennini DSM 20253]